MRILFSSTWGLGHVFPMVPLARALVAGGHDVLWVAHEPACPPIEAAGIAARGAGWSRPQVEAAFQEMMRVTQPLPPDERAAVAFPTMFGAGATPALLPGLLSAAREWAPDLLVHEPAELAAPLVAAMLDLDCVTHSWGPAVPAAIVRDAAVALEPLWAAHGLSVPEFAGCFRSGYLDLCPEAVHFVPTDHVSRPAPLRPVGYQGPGNGRLDAEVLPPGDRPLAYVTLGTVFSDPGLVRVAVDAAVAAGCRVVVTVGPRGTPEALGGSEGVAVHRWVPQDRLLPHTSLVISHAGSGTFLGALGAGLPQLCLPQAADQFRNASAAVRSGTGLSLAGGEATPEALRSAIAELLTEPRYRVAAQVVAGQIAGMPAPETVAATLTGRE